MSEQRVRWHDVHTSTFARSTDEDHKILVTREAIPLVLVPGIMGSRLRRRDGGELAWDPPSGAWNSARAAWKWGFIDGGERRNLLIGPEHDPEFLQVDPGTQEILRRYGLSPGQAETAVANGWGAVHWSSYGEFLQRVSTAPGHGWPSVDRFFTFPVYAVGYNWTASNRNSGAKLADRLDEIIAENDRGDTFCEKVVLLTHSMGGYVARAAMRFDGAESKVAGVVHVVQPVTGAPATYKRARAGFEGLEALVLGWNAGEVTPLLADGPGILELLPSHLYRDNDGVPDWLQIKVGRDTLFGLPRHGDPYDEIYAERTAFWRLVDEILIDPSGRADRGRWDRYLQHLDEARAFHAELGLGHHPRSYAVWGDGTEHPTWDRLVWSIEEGRMSPDARTATTVWDIPSAETVGRLAEAGFPVAGTDGLGTCFFERPPRARHRLRARIQPPDGEGDGTVPVSSGRALGLADQVAKSGIPHQKAFLPQDGCKHSQVYDSLIFALQQILLAHHRDRVGDAGP